MIRVGLTGGIASGKTTIAQFFLTLGVPVYFSDEQAKKLMHFNPIKDKLVELLGNETYIGGVVLNKAFVSSKIFNNKFLLESVNKIVHPVVQEDFDLFCKENKKKAYIVKESAILFETGLIKDLDKIILITANKEDRVNRIAIRDRLSNTKIKQKISKQFEDSKKISFADFIIENNNKDFIIPQLVKIHNKLVNLSNTIEF